MRVCIDTSKKGARAVLVLASVLFVTIFVFAYGGNNPTELGHSENEIEVNDSGVIKTLGTYVNDVEARISGGSGSGNLNCTTVSQTFSSGAPALYCPSGYTITGGSCDGISGAMQPVGIYRINRVFNRQGFITHATTGNEGWECEAHGSSFFVNISITCCEGVNHP